MLKIRFLSILWILLLLAPFAAKCAETITQPNYFHKYVSKSNAVKYLDSGVARTADMSKVPAIEQKVLTPSTEWTIQSFYYIQKITGTVKTNTITNVPVAFKVDVPVPSKECVETPRHIVFDPKYKGFRLWLNPIVDVNGKKIDPCVWLLFTSKDGIDNIAPYNGIRSTVNGAEVCQSPVEALQ